MIPQLGLIGSGARMMLQDAPPRPGWVLVLVLIWRRGDDRQLDFVGIGVSGVLFVQTQDGVAGSHFDGRKQRHELRPNFEVLQKVSYFNYLGWQIRVIMGWVRLNLAKCTIRMKAVNA